MIFKKISALEILTVEHITYAINFKNKKRNIKNFNEYCVSYYPVTWAYMCLMFRSQHDSNTRVNRDIIIYRTISTGQAFSPTHSPLVFMS